MIHAGKMDRRITVQSFTTTENALGEPVEAWTDADTIWASISYGTGSERREAALDQSSQVATFNVRASVFTRTIKPTTHRLIFDGLTFDIASVVPSIKRGKHISLTATARTS